MACNVSQLPAGVCVLEVWDIGEVHMCRRTTHLNIVRVRSYLDDVSQTCTKPACPHAFTKCILSPSLACILPSTPTPTNTLTHQPLPHTFPCSYPPPLPLSSSYPPLSLSLAHIHPLLPCLLPTNYSLTSLLLLTTFRCTWRVCM